MRNLSWSKIFIVTAALLILVAANGPPFATYAALDPVETQRFRQASTQPPPTKLEIETIVNLGVSAGNGTSPRHLALNSPAGKVYILSQGIPVLEQGNGLSVYDIETGEISDHVKINEGVNEPLDLQFDPRTGLIYALWRAQFGDTSPTLTVIDGQSLEVIQNIPGFSTLAAANGKVYVANNEQLVVFEVKDTRLVETQRVEIPMATPGPIVVSPDTNRLYLAQNIAGAWLLQIFEADSLKLIASYPAEAPIVEVIPLPDKGEVLVVTVPYNIRVLNRLSTDGQVVSQPFELGPRLGAGGLGLSQDGERLYFSDGQLRSTELEGSAASEPTLVGLSSNADLSPLLNLSLLTNLDDMVVDDPSNQLFALYTPSNFLYVISLADQTVRIVNTAIELKDVLFEAESDQIFVSDSANQLRRLEAVSLSELNRSQLQGNSLDFGFNSTAWSGELSLDPGRNRLYVSGLPATVLQADTLSELAVLEPGGQLTPDPSGDKIYVSNCGLTVLKADTLDEAAVIADSGPRADGLSPNPCVGYSQLDSPNQRLYSLVPNGVPGSNSGRYLYVYDLAAEPSLIYSDTNISTVRVEADSFNRRAFTNFVREGNKRLRTLQVPASGAGPYTHQLLGVWGDTRFSPTTGRLYLADRNHERLLTLDANTLAVLDELVLPPKFDYRLAALDPTADRLYLIGLDGQLLVAAPAEGQAGISEVSAQPRAPIGKIFELVSTGPGAFLARIEAQDDNAFGSRLYLTADEGQSWTDLSQNLPSLSARAMAVSPTDGQYQTFFAGLLNPGQTGGLYKSTDSGRSWVPAMSGLQDLGVDGLYISPDFAQDGLVLAKTVHAGLHQSSDGGQNWTPLLALDPNDLFPGASQTAAVAFDGQGTVLASQALVDMSGIFRANLRPDGSLSAWEQSLDLPVELLAFSPDGRLALGFGNGLWRSTDGGQMWQAGGAGLTGIDSLRPHRFLFSPGFSQDDTVYIFFKDLFGETPGLLFRSTDAGQSWQSWLDPVSGGNNFTAVTLAPTGDFMFGDGQAQLTRISPAELVWLEPDQVTDRFPLSDIAASPDFDVDQTVFALSSEQGLYKSTDGGFSWALLDFPVRSYRFSPRDYRLAISPNFGADQTLYIATGRSLHRSTDGGQSWEQLTLTDDSSSNLAGPGFPAQRVALSPNYADEPALLAGTATAIYRSVDGGDVWRQVLAPETGASNLDILAFAPNGVAAYARFGFSQNLFKSTDGGQMWQAEPSNMGELFSLIDSTTSPADVLTSAVEFDRRLLQTDVQSQPWRDFGGSLPTELSKVQAIVYGPADNFVIGGQGGAFRSAADGRDWRSVSAGLPADANVTSLYATDTQLFAALGDGSLFTSADSDDSWLDISVVK
jgi:DNA-binding beta-propeller fold protein YncE